MRLGDTPVPIPNTMVKTWSADGTILETVWESRWMPLHIFLNENEQSEFRKIAHLIERSEMMVLPRYFLVKTSESEV